MRALFRSAVYALLLSGCFLDRSGTRPTMDAGTTRDAGTDAGTGTDAGPPPVDAPPDAPGPDRDGDGVPDATDVCPDFSDPAQEDLDGDGLGDACDPDADGDAIPDERDLCPGRDSRGAPDEDHDGILDACDDCPLDPDRDQANADFDRLGDACEDPNPTRFSRVALLETFTGSFGSFVPDSSVVRLAGGGVDIDDAAEHTLVRAEDTSFPSNRLAVHVIGHYFGARGTTAAGELGALLRWTTRDSTRFGYRLSVRAGDDLVRLDRHDGGGCGPLLDEECVLTLIDRELGLRVDPGTNYSLRATTYDTQLVLDVRNAAGVHTTHVVTDVRHAVGGLGLITREAHVRFDALAVYAP